MANGKVEGIVGDTRRNFMVPIPRCASWEAFNADLEAQCRTRQNDMPHVVTRRRSANG